MVFSYRKSIPTAEFTTKCGGSDIGWRVGTFKTLAGPLAAIRVCGGREIVCDSGPVGMRFRSI